MRTELPAVSVVIPALECAAHIRGCITAVANQTYQGPLEVIVALAPSKDGTAEVLDDLIDELGPQLPIRVIDNLDITTPAALNAAVRLSDAPIVARADAQSRLQPDYIDQAVKTMLRTGAANVGGVQRPVSRAADGKAAAIAAALSSSFGGGPAAFRRGNHEGATDTVYLGVFNRTVLNAVGGFDESLERNQDYELNWRLRQAGHVVWIDPNLVVDYLPRDNYRALATQHFDYGTWKRTVLLRHPRSLKLRQLAAPTLLAALALSLIDLLRGRLSGAVIPVAYAAACIGATSRLRSSLPAMSDRLRAAFACAVIHLSWAAGFFFGHTNKPNPKSKVQP